ncbi:MAG TPA: hypothetical protein VJT31_25885, partial [Rugosimonospora sp.]|nr:hypothetical protein [Rugosimonospora sp.]
LSGEKDARLAQQNFDFDKALTTSGVVHRFCTGTGTHSWPFWQTDMVDFLRYAYGTGPDTSQCDNA